MIDLIMVSLAIPAKAGIYLHALPLIRGSWRGFLLVNPPAPLSGEILFLLDSCLRRNDKTWIFRGFHNRRI
jgi:hypothetical protein